MERKDFVNKVEQSGIVTVDLLAYQPKQEIIFFDLKDYLYKEMIIKETEFRKSIDSTDWNVFKDQLVAIGCSVDAIIPTWVYMTIGIRLNKIAAYFDFTDVQELQLQVWKAKLSHTDFSHLAGRKVVIRANASILPSLYLIATDKLKPIVQTLMFGEAGMPKVIYKKSNT